MTTTGPTVPTVPQQTELREGPVGASILRRRALELAMQRARRSYTSAAKRQCWLGTEAVEEAARRVAQAERAVLDEALVALGGKPRRGRRRP